MNTFLHTYELPNKALQCQADLDLLISENSNYAFLKDEYKRVSVEGKGFAGEVDYKPEDYRLMSAYHFLSEYFRQLRQPIMLSNIKEYDNILELKGKKQRKHKKQPKIAQSFNIYMIAEEFEKSHLPETAIYNVMPI